jgi:beta-lactamase superfamily II metal-dependent hydrolase
MRKTMTIGILFLALFCGVSLSGLSQLKVGDQLPLWKEGYLDIHHINTGKGECAFFMLPDGTTLLVDAGATARPKPRVTDPKPDGSRTPGEWISRYILHFLQNRPEKKLNYILLTHFHDDHIGGTYSGVKPSESGNFILSGITEVGTAVPFDKIVDSNWPGYDYPKPFKGENIDNYIRFVKWNIEQKGARAEQFRVGVNDQFTLLHNPAKYPGFEIRNLASNGQVWTGVGNNVRNHFPPLESLPENQYPGENACSSAFRLSYGKFDYFNGGDITTGAPGSWQDIETPVGLVTGPVEVCIANHHAFYDAMSALFLQAVRPRVHIILVWAPSQPSPSVLARMMSTWTYPGPRDIFATNTMEETRVVSGRMENLQSQQGHIVVRVSPGGEEYMIYILDDSAEKFKVTAIHGPYSCE